MRDLFEWHSFQDEFATAALGQGFVRETLLETEDGPLLAWTKFSEAPLVYLSAGIHGDEPAGPLAVLEMMEGGVFDSSCSWMICPALNPGGLVCHTRENRAGADLNRDYFQLTTLEVSAHSRWLSRQPVPELFVSLHEDWESSGFYFYEINLTQDRPEIAESIFSAVAPVFSREPGPLIDGHEVRAPGWIFHCAEADLPDSWPEAIWLAKRGCPLSFTFETPSRASLADRTRAHIAAFRELLLQTS